MAAKLALAVLASFSLLFIGPLQGEAQEQNCPLDWHPPPCGVPSQTVQSPEQKQRTKVWVERLDRATVAVDLLAGISAVYCAASLESDMCWWSKTYIQIAVGLRVARWWVNLTDPFDPLYGAPYDPPGGDLGLTCEDNPLLGYCVWMANRLQEISMFLDGVYVSINRAQSCLDVGNVDCFIWQKRRFEYFLWAAGITMEAAAYGMAVASDNMRDGELAGYARATSDELYIIGGEMRGECPWC